ncbi:unnamed protein product [Closterium sp. NIES-64]|nr:unnamed protein product [Closterium sp. NIES-64]
MGGATGEDGPKYETAHEAGGNSGSGATAHGAGENAGSGATAHNAGKEGGEAATAHETGEERGEIATVHGTMREGMAVLIDVNGEKASFAMLQRNRTARVGKQQCSLAPLIGCPYRLSLFPPSSSLLPVPTLPPFPILPSSPPRAPLSAQNCAGGQAAVLPRAPHRLRLSCFLRLPFILSSSPANFSHFSLPPFPPLCLPPPHPPLPTPLSSSPAPCEWASSTAPSRPSSAAPFASPHSPRPSSPLPPSTVRVGKQQCSLAPLIGCPFGQAASGHEVVRALAANSVSFLSKTDFAQVMLRPVSSLASGSIASSASHARLHLLLQATLSPPPPPIAPRLSHSPHLSFSLSPFIFLTLPTYLSSLPNHLSSLPTYLSSLPTYLSSLPTYLSSPPTYLSSLPTYLSSLPVRALQFPAPWQPGDVTRATFERHLRSLAILLTTGNVFLRPDSLAMLLAMANVGAHSQVLVLDGTGGLITAAAAQRMGGHGAICSAFYASHVSHAPSIDIIRHLNLSLPAAAMYVSATPPSLLPLP